MTFRARFTLIVLLSAAAGCARGPAVPDRPVTWYVGTLGGNDYFHEGRTPTDGRNYRLPQGQLDLGVSFPLSTDPAQWRRVDIIQPATQPAPTTAPGS